jgi:hypothetical protein
MEKKIKQNGHQRVGKTLLRARQVPISRKLILVWKTYSYLRRCGYELIKLTPPTPHPQSEIFITIIAFDDLSTGKLEIKKNVHERVLEKIQRVLETFLSFIWNVFFCLRTTFLWMRSWQRETRSLNGKKRSWWIERRLFYCYFSMESIEIFL